MRIGLISALLVPLAILCLLPPLALQIGSARERVRAARVAALMAQARALTEERKYGEAIGVVEQILVIDPRNDYAIGVRPLLEDGGGLSEQRRFRERSDLELPAIPDVGPATNPAAPAATHAQEGGGRERHRQGSSPPDEARLTDH